MFIIIQGTINVFCYKFGLFLIAWLALYQPEEIDIFCLLIFHETCCFCVVCHTDSWSQCDTTHRSLRQYWPLEGIYSVYWCKISALLAALSSYRLHCFMLLCLIIVLFTWKIRTTQAWRRFARIAWSILVYE